MSLGESVYEYNSDNKKIMGIIHEAKLQESSHEDDTNCGKPLDRKLSNSSMNVPVTEEDVKDAECFSKLDSSNNVDSRGKVQEKPFQRIWMRDDEIDLLHIMIDRMEQNAAQPRSYEDIFSHIREHPLSFQPTRIQLKEKIRHLREKYKKNAKEPQKFMKSYHEVRLFELSSQVWGVEQSDFLQSSGTIKGNCHSKAKEILEDEKDTFAVTSNSALHEQVG
nr:probable transcription factor At4g00390 [Coffea arabica]